MKKNRLSQSTHMRLELTTEDDRSKFLAHTAFRAPSNDLLESIFIHFFQSTKSKLWDEIRSVKGSIISWDHTFSFPKMLNLFTDQGHETSPFEAVLFIMNEHSEVMRFCATKTTQLGEIEPVLSEIAEENEITCLVSGKNQF